MDRIQDVLASMAAPATGKPGMARAAQMLSQPGSLAETSAGQGPASSFSDLLTGAIKTVQQAQNESSTLQKAYQQGSPQVGLEETMIAMNKASLSFQMLAQARNRVVAAYNEVMNMPV